MTAEKTGWIDSMAAYQAEVLRTGGGQGESVEMRMSLAGMGLAGEAGEVVDLLKKIVHHQKPLTPELRQKLILEGGDVFWYLAYLADVLETTLGEMAAANVAKLRQRYPDGFTVEAANAPRPPEPGDPVVTTADDTQRVAEFERGLSFGAVQQQAELLPVYSSPAATLTPPVRKCSTCKFYTDDDTLGKSCVQPHVARGYVEGSGVASARCPAPEHPLWQIRVEKNQ